MARELLKTSHRISGDREVFLRPPGGGGIPDTVTGRGEVLLFQHESEQSRRRAFSELAQRERELTGEFFATEPGTAEVMVFMRGLYGRARAVENELMRRLPPDGRLACREDCDPCCHRRVPATAPEALYLADALNRSLAAEDLHNLLARLRASSAGDATAAAPSNDTPCPLLVSRRCQAYEARPFDCRGYNALDGGLCRSRLASRSADPRPEKDDYEPKRHLATVYQSALLAASSQLGHPTEVLDLARALLAALTTPDAAARWLAGENVFA